MTTLTKGDRVRFNQNYDYPILKGDEGTVVDTPFLSELLAVKVDKTDRTHYVYGWRLSKIEAKPKFKIGDRVVAKDKNNYTSHTDKPLVVLAQEYGVNGVGPVGNDASKAHSEKGWYAYADSSLELYAPTFKVGDYVEVWGYSPDSSWEGKKGEVKEVSSSYVFIKPEDGGYSGAFRADQLRTAVRPVKTVLEKAGLKVGDKVRPTKGNENLFNHNFAVTGGTVVEYSSPVYIKATLENGGYIIALPEEIEKGAPEQSIKVGDWVEAHGRGDKWDGTQGEVLRLQVYGLFIEIKSTDGQTLHFEAKKLKKAKRPEQTILEKHGYKVGDKVRAKGYQSCLTSEFNTNGGTIAEAKVGDKYIRITLATGSYDDALPAEIELGSPVPVFKTGDYVEVQGYSGYSGTKGEVQGNSNWGGRKRVLTESGSMLHFLPENLKKAERPVKKSWAEKAQTGDVFVTKSWAGTVTRFLTKKADGRWSLQYPNSSAVNDCSNAEVAYFTATKV